MAREVARSSQSRSLGRSKLRRPKTPKNLTARFIGRRHGDRDRRRHQFYNMLLFSQAIPPTPLNGPLRNFNT